MTLDGWNPLVLLPVASFVVLALRPEELRVHPVGQDRSISACSLLSRARRRLRRPLRSIHGNLSLGLASPRGITLLAYDRRNAWLPGSLSPLLIVAAGGLVAGGKGVMDRLQARSIATDAKGRHDVAVSDLNDVQRVTQDIVEEYGRSQLHAQRDTIGRFAD